MTISLSIITTVYKSEKYIARFLDQAVQAGERFGGKFEIIVVDDGSPDQSRLLAQQKADQDARIRVIELSRNFGHHPAFWCGMHHARGEHCFLIDSDLEVAPAVLSNFQEKMAREQADVVYGVQEKRQGMAQTRILGGLFWKVFGALSDVDVPADVMTERLMTRGYLDALLRMNDYNLFLAGMFYWPGFRQVPIPLSKAPRSDKGSYSLMDRVKLLVEAISSFSSVPLTFIFWLGMAVFGVSMLYSGYLLLRKLMFPETLVDGFTFLALVTAGTGGIVLAALGIIGLYVHRIFKQVQARPIFIVRNIYTGDLDE